VTAAPARPRKGHRERRYRVNLKPPGGRLRERKMALEALIDKDHFDPALSASLDRVLVALERRTEAREA
jgi:hypothetical protein